MACTIVSSGTLTPTLATDTTIGGVDITAPIGGAVYALRVSAHNLVGAETLSLSALTDGEAGGTMRLCDDPALFFNVQSVPMKDGRAIYVPGGGKLRFVLRQDGGTARAFPWWIYRLDG